MPGKHGDLGCATHAALPCLLLQPQQALEGPAEEGGRCYRMFQPPVTQLASVEQREPKQAASEVKSDADILVHWSRPGRWTETRV